MSIPRITEILEKIVNLTTGNVNVDIIDKKIKSSATNTRPANTTAYTANDVVGADPGANLTFASVGVAGQGIILLKASLRIDVAAIPSGMLGFRLHLFNAAPTAITDNLAFNVIAADRSKYLGYIEFPTPVDLGDTLYTQIENLTFTTTLVTTSLYGVLETLGAFTPSSATVKEITISGVDA